MAGNGRTDGARPGHAVRAASAGTVKVVGLPNGDELQPAGTGGSRCARGRAGSGCAARASRRCATPWRPWYLTPGDGPPEWWCFGPRQTPGARTAPEGPAARTTRHRAASSGAPSPASCTRPARSRAPTASAGVRSSGDRAVEDRARKASRSPYGGDVTASRDIAETEDAGQKRPGAGPGRAARAAAPARSARPTAGALAGPVLGSPLSGPPHGERPRAGSIPTTRRWRAAIRKERAVSPGQAPGAYPARVPAPPRRGPPRPRPQPSL